MSTLTRAAAALILLASPALAQVNLTTGATKGRTLTYEVTQTLAIEQRTAPDADPASYKSEILASLTLNVTEVDASGNARVECAVAAFRSRYEDPQGPTSVNFDMKKDENPAGLAAIESALIDATIAFTVSDKGAISDITGLDALVGAIQQTPDANVQLFGFFRNELLTELFSKIFAAEGGIGDHAIGDAWDDSRRIALGSGGALEITTKSTLTAAEQGAAIINGATSFELYVPRERAQDVPAVSLANASGQAKTTWDIEHGALLVRTDSQDVAMDWSRGEGDSALRIIQTQHSESRIERQR